MFKLSIFLNILKKWFGRRTERYQADDELMDGDQFWNIVDESLSKSNGNYDRQQAVLINILSRVNPEDVIHFDNRLRQLRGNANTWKLLGAIYLIHSGCGDDSFLDFREWVIAQGRDFYYRTVDDPETLADYDTTKMPIDMEGLGYIPGDVFEGLTGQEIPAAYFENDAMKGTEWKDEVDLRKQLPRLWAKFGHS